ncbi:MAG: ISNCY family transposase [Patescibacteria group bacterium]
MSKKEVLQIEVFEKLVRKEIKQKTVANLLELSIRQVQRKIHNFKLHGAESLIHKSRGKTSNNKIPQEKLDRAMELIKEKYYDFAPTLASEKLLENHKIKLSVEKLRQEMIEVGIWKPKRKKKAQVHQLRERRACFGELVQLDGSPHDWFEGRAPRCNLNVAIDDATGKSTFKFSQVETTQDYFKLVEKYFLRCGLPIALYVDKHNIFRVNTPTNLDLNKPSKNESEGLTQFGRAMKELGVALIFANTPQAKGRVEKVNRTLQDRLVKEMRINHITSIEEANQFLPKFINKFNHRFSVKPRSGVDMHRKLDKRIDLTKILCTKETRVISKNLTFQYNNTIFQIKTKRSAYTLRKTTITLCERYDGTIKVFDSRDKLLEYTTIKKLPNTRATNGKLLNHKLDAILVAQAQTNYQKRNPWESNFDELTTDNYYYKPNGAV